jgi:hypothetical protein
MKGYKFSYFVLMLSFIGWYIVGAFALGIGGLWVYPYQYCTEANFYAWRVANDTNAQPEVYQANYSPVADSNVADDEPIPQADEEVQNTESFDNTAEQTVAEDFRENAAPVDIGPAVSSELPATDEMPETIDFSESSEIPEESVITDENTDLPDTSSETEE